MRFLLLLFILSLSTLASNKLEKVSLQLKWKHQFQFAGFYMAKAKGFYHDEGLDVTIKEFNKNINILQSVLDGKSDFGVHDSQLIYHKLHNRPITALMAIFQNSPLTILTTKQHNITTLKALDNKTIEFTDKQNYETAINILLKTRNIHVKKIAPSFTLDALIMGKVDAILGYLSNEPYLLYKQGIEGITFSPQDYGITTYGDILFSSQKFIQKHPDISYKFYKASKKGWEYAFAHIDETIEIIQKHYNTQNKSVDALQYEAKVLKELSQIEEGNFGNLSYSRLQVIANSLSVLFPDKYNLNSLDHFIYTPTPLHFTSREQHYLSQKHQLKVCYAPLYYPVITQNKETPSGIAIDYLQEIADSTKLKLHYIRTETWSQHLALLKANQCDIVPLVVTSPNNYQDFLTLSNPYVGSYLVAVSQSQQPYTYDLNSLKDKKIGVVTEGKNMMGYIKGIYPNLKIVQLHDDNLQQILDGKVDIIITSFIRAAYSIPKYDNRLKILTRLGEQKIEGSLGINVHDTTLLNIINKSLDAIPQNKKDAILAKYHINNIQFQRIIDYSLLYKTIMVALAIIAILLFFHFKLQKLNRKINRLNQELESRVNSAIADLRKKDKILQQQSKLAQMGEMISMIAHQWRQPLSTLSNIIANLQIKFALNNQEFLELSDKKLHEMSELIQSMSMTINDFRAFYKPHKESHILPLSHPITKALNILQNTLERKNIHLECNFDFNEEVEFYPNEIMQVILNIIKNAEDNFEEKSIQAPYIKIITSKENNQYTISICDNGGGIEKKILEHIFEPYFSTKSDQNGTGLGLYMSKMIIEEHHKGKLEAFNHKDGVCFKLVLNAKLS